jgi:hypothetical protein
MVSIRPSSSSVVEDSNTSKEDGSSAHSSTKSRTWVAVFHRASRSVSISHCAACFATSSLVASFSRSASQARPKGGPSIGSQTLVPCLSRRYHRFSYFQNSATSSSTTSTRRVLVGKRLSTISVAEDITTWSIRSSLIIWAWRRAPICIPSNR